MSLSTLSMTKKKQHLASQNYISFLIAVLKVSPEAGSASTCQRLIKFLIRACKLR